MALFPKIHFDISERKVLLRLLDIVFTLTFLNLISSIFEFDYFMIDKENWSSILILVVYLIIFGTVFELYNLKQASNFLVVLKNTILTVSVTTLFFLLTPYYTPVLPENRLQILYFFVAITAGILIWRSLYIGLISSPRFYKRVLLVGETMNISKIIKNLEGADPNYKVVGFVTEENSIKEEYPGIIQFSPEDLVRSVGYNDVSEIVVAGDYGKGVSLKVYNQLINLLESGFPIREYTQVYEEVAQRSTWIRIFIPISHLAGVIKTSFICFLIACLISFVH
jgi:FlaA1/EpsC-like NDP-sugar epimerase